MIKNVRVMRFLPLPLLFFAGGKRKIESWVCFFFPSPFSSHRFVPMSHDSEWVIGGGEEREGSLDREGGS